MHKVIGFLAAAATLAFAFIAQAPAQTVRKDATGAPATTLERAPAATVKKPKTPIRDTVGTKPTTVAPLTEQECTDLGGTVNTESYGVCNSGKFCGRRDENGKVHRVCINAK